MPTSTVEFTPAQRRELEVKCRNRLNWSDGGYWIGSGPAPNCFQKETLTNRISHTIRFPTDAAANKWNSEWEKSIRYAGHVGTAVLTVTVTLATGGTIVPIIVGTAAAIAKDELQARIPYPRMERGWSYNLIFEHEFFWSAHPWGRKSFTQVATAIVRNHEKNEVKKSVMTSKFNLDELPDGIARTISAAPSRSTESVYA